MEHWTRKLILDCDPGHDDALAILLAAGSPRSDLLAITTVAGNQTLDKTTLNARRVCSVAGIRNVPIAAGSSAPLRRPLRTAEDIHGPSGLDGTKWGEPTVAAVPDHAVDVIVDLVLSSPGEVTLVPTGPLTNIALALRREPRLVSCVRDVVLMGGSYSRGNTTPAAEFNILVDPEAASIVFQAGWPLTMVGLDLTHQALATPTVLRRIEAIRSPLSRMVVDVLSYFRDAYWQRFQFPDPPVHDPCAVARVLYPESVTCTDAYVAIEVHGEWTTGMTVTDFDESLHQPNNALVAITLDVDGFWTVMIDAIRTLSGPSGNWM